MRIRMDLELELQGLCRLCGLPMLMPLHVCGERYLINTDDEAENLDKLNQNYWLLPQGRLDWLEQARQEVVLAVSPFSAHDACSGQITKVEPVTEERWYPFSSLHKSDSSE